MLVFFPPPSSKSVLLYSYKIPQYLIEFSRATIWVSIFLCRKCLTTDLCLLVNDCPPSSGSCAQLMHILRFSWILNAHNIFLLLLQIGPCCLNWCLQLFEWYVFACLFLISVHCAWGQYLKSSLQRPEFGFINFYVDVSLSFVPITYSFPFFLQFGWSTCHCLLS